MECQKEILPCLNFLAVFGVTTHYFLQKAAEDMWKMEWVYFLQELELEVGGGDH